GGDEKRRDAARTAVEIFLVLALDGTEAADAGRDEHAHTRRQLRRDSQTGIVHREVRRGERVLDKGVDFLDVLLLDELQRVEAVPPAGNLAGELGGGEARDPADAAAPRAERLPVGFGADAERRNQPDSRDDDPPAQTASNGGLLLLGVLLDVFDRFLHAGDLL